MYECACGMCMYVCVCVCLHVCACSGVCMCVHACTSMIVCVCVCVHIMCMCVLKFLAANEVYHKKIATKKEVGKLKCILVFQVNSGTAQ